MFRIRYSFDIRRAFYNFLQVFFLGWLVCLVLGVGFIVSSLGFPGFFVLLSMDTWFHPAFWFAPLFVAGFVAFQRGLIIDIDDGYINDRNDV